MNPLTIRQRMLDLYVNLSCCLGLPADGIGDKMASIPAKEGTLPGVVVE